MVRTRGDSLRYLLALGVGAAIGLLILTTGSVLVNRERFYGLLPSASFVSDSANAQQSAGTGIKANPSHTVQSSTRIQPSKIPKLQVEDWTGVDVTVLPAHYPYNDVDRVHRVVSSVSMADKKYFMIDFLSSEAYNPNIIPHSSWNDSYIIVAQAREHSVENSVFWAELVCTAKFFDETLRCIKEPMILPIAATFGDGLTCPPELGFTRLGVGPHDARVFFGPKKPYAIYGSNSKYPCLGQWVQDFRLLVDWGMDSFGWGEFKYGTELMRPGEWGSMEKNWFIFWDDQEQMYIHHDVWPQRTFAKLEEDGSVGPDLSFDAIGDEKCMAAYMPSKAEVLEGIHQSTNSLLITLCGRYEPGCVPESNNTFVFTIFQHKSYYAFHGNYEPFVMVFRQQAPFDIIGIAQKPIFINGRTRPGDPVRPPWLNEAHYAQTEMFYVTSMSWKTHGQKYHGYLDDVLFLAFGIEDQKNGAIDIVAGDLFLDLGLCAQIS